jgi:hypothetical protein
MKRHKYFRDQLYKQKLESRYNGSRRKYTNVYFITKEPDPRAVRESNNFYISHPDITPEEWEKARGREYYIAYSRPEIAYSIQEHKHGRSAARVLFKKRAKKKLKTAYMRDPDGNLNHGTFRKVYDPWHFD